MISTLIFILAQAKPVGFFSPSLFNVWTLLPIILLLILAWLLNMKINELADVVKRLKSAVDKPAFSKPSPDKELKTFKEDIQNRISVLNDEISKLQLEIRTPAPTKQPTPVIVKKTNNEPVKAASVEVFYMSQPIENYFPQRARSGSKENTLYQFKITGNNEATFEVINDGANISQAADYASSYFDPACNSENLPGGQVKRITTTKAGKARFEGDKWIIIQKATIRYE
jgi:hypothetical protein